MFEDDRRSPKEVRDFLKEERKAARDRPVPDRPSPQRHPREVREQFRKEGLRGQGRRSGD